MNGIEVTEHQTPRGTVLMPQEVQAARRSEIDAAYKRGRGDGFLTLTVGMLTGLCVGFLFGAALF